MQTCPFGMPRKSIILYVRKLLTPTAVIAWLVSVYCWSVFFWLSFSRLIFFSAVLRSLLLDMDQGVASTGRV